MNQVILNSLNWDTISPHFQRCYLEGTPGDIMEEVREMLLKIQFPLQTEIVEGNKIKTGFKYPDDILPLKWFNFENL